MNEKKLFKGHEDDNVFIMPVAAGTNVGKLAACIKEEHKKNPTCQLILRLIGAGPSNQAAKAVVILNRWLWTEHREVCMIEPRFALNEEPEKGTVMEWDLHFITKQ